jgi:kinesin family protein C1
MKFVFLQYDMEASFLEIYNETIRDLLAAGDATTKHEIKQVVTNNGKQANDVFVTNLKTVSVKSTDQVRSAYNHLDVYLLLLIEK